MVSFAADLHLLWIVPGSRANLP